MHIANSIKILWVEEETTTALAERLGYLRASFDYDYDINICATYLEAQEAIEKAHEYHLILIDIRIPYGDSSNRTEKKDGKTIIKELFDKDGGDPMSKLLVYTNESWKDVNKDDFLTSKGITEEAFKNKKDCASNADFEDFILKKLNRN